MRRMRYEDGDGDDDDCYFKLSAVFGNLKLHPDVSRSFCGTMRRQFVVAPAVATTSWAKHAQICKRKLKL